MREGTENIKLNKNIRLRLLLREISRNIRKKLLGRYIIDFKDINDENLKNIIYKVSKMARIKNKIKDFFN